LLSRILVPPSSSSSVASQGKTTTIPLEKREESNGDGTADQHHPSMDSELITGVIGGVLDLLKVRKKFLLGPGFQWVLNRWFRKDNFSKTVRVKVKRNQTEYFLPPIHASSLSDVDPEPRSFILDPVPPFRNFCLVAMIQS
jgi:hypothetical protein